MPWGGDVDVPPYLDLMIHPERLAVVRLEASAPFPEWAAGAFLSLTRTEGELSVVCREDAVPEGPVCERGWRRISVAGVLDFALTGILAALADPLAAAGIPVFAISTYDTDHLLIKSGNLARAAEILEKAGHRLIGSIEA
jgi:uncharacterized protein